MPIKDIGAEELRALIKEKREQMEIIDVRSQDEYDVVHVKDSKLIPINEIQARAGEIDWNKEVVFLCLSGNRSKMAAMLVSMGRDVKNLQYGIYECYKDGKGENLVVDKDNIDKYF